MKKMMLPALLLLSTVLLPAAACAQSGAAGQLNSVAGQSQSATRSNTAEGARSGAGGGIDTQGSSSSSSSVSGNTVQILRNSDGTNPYSRYEGHAIRHTAPPPLK